MTIDIEKIKQDKSIKELLEFGIINIDKSSGPTSFNVSEFVKKSLNLRKTSHFGTLDPKVTGVLPVALNRACKLTGYFLGEDKTYVGIARIHEEISVEDLEKEIKKSFLGEITQMPPVKSRVKRQNRQREIYEFKILEKKGNDFLFLVKCEGGTYIRKLISDLGDKLGSGAHMLELRRLQAGIFDEHDKDYPIVNLYDFEKAVDEYKKGYEKLLRKIIIPAEIVCKVYSEVMIKEKNLKQILTGKPIHNLDLEKKPLFNKDTIVTIFCGKIFVGMYKVLDQGDSTTDIFAKPEFVMQDIK